MNDLAVFGSGAGNRGEEARTLGWCVPSTRVTPAAYAPAAPRVPGPHTPDVPPLTREAPTGRDLFGQKTRRSQHRLGTPTSGIQDEKNSNDWKFGGSGRVVT
jgi:hypothetical protein